MGFTSRVKSTLVLAGGGWLVDCWPSAAGEAMMINIIAQTNFAIGLTYYQRFTAKTQRTVLSILRAFVAIYSVNGACIAGVLIVGQINRQKGVAMKSSNLFSVKCAPSLVL